MSGDCQTAGRGGGPREISAPGREFAARERQNAGIAPGLMLVQMFLKLGQSDFMTNLDATIQRLRALPDSEKDAVAARIELLLDGDADDLLSPEQWAEIEARLDSDEGFTPHEEVVRDFRERFGNESRVGQ